MTAVWMVVGAAEGAVVLAGALLTVRRSMGQFRPFWLTWASLSVLTGLLAGDWPQTVLSVVALGVLGWDWWNRRGKRAAQAIGAKSRALLAAVVEKAREAGTPMPSPEGARA